MIPQLVRAGSVEPFEVNTAEGRVTVYKPQLRDTDRPFRSKLSAFLKNNSEVLEICKGALHQGT